MNLTLLIYQNHYIPSSSLSSSCLCLVSPSLILSPWIRFYTFPALLSSFSAHLFFLNAGNFHLSSCFSYISVNFLNMVFVPCFGSPTFFLLLFISPPNGWAFSSVFPPLRLPYVLHPSLAQSVSLLSHQSSNLLLSILSCTILLHISFKQPVPRQRYSSWVHLSASSHW